MHLKQDENILCLSHKTPSSHTKCICENKLLMKLCTHNSFNNTISIAGLSVTLISTILTPNHYSIFNRRGTRFLSQNCFAGYAARSQQCRVSSLLHIRTNSAASAFTCIQVSLLNIFTRTLNDEFFTLN